MKPVRKMVMANVAIMINKDEPKQCGNTAGKMCRFLVEETGDCRLFAKKLKVDKKAQQFLRCNPCIEAEPID